MNILINLVLYYAFGLVFIMLGYFFTLWIFSPNFRNKSDRRGLIGQCFERDSWWKQHLKILIAGVVIATVLSTGQITVRRMMHDYHWTQMKERLQLKKVEPIEQHPVQKQ